ncbi:hypothetical protein FJY69_07845, partial [candidate division WOR-3 bacterium]|nr:hypothetical protein [candidate division WOR-3 bacterium]
MLPERMVPAVEHRPDFLLQRRDPARVVAVQTERQVNELPHLGTGRDRRDADHASAQSSGARSSLVLDISPPLPVVKIFRVHEPRRAQAGFRDRHLVESRRLATPAGTTERSHSVTKSSCAGVLLAAAVAFAAPGLSLSPGETGPLTISLSQGYAFDPLVELPELPPNLAVEGYDGEHGYYVVQFPGPVRSEWKAAAERAGAELLWYLPNYAFIARIANDRAAAVSALSEVRWLGLYQPAFKLLRGLDKASGRHTLIVVFFKAEDEYQMLDQLAALGADNITPEFNKWNHSVKLDVDAARIADIAQLPGVYWIETWGEITPDNADCQWVDMHGYSASDTTRTIWAKGVTGSSVYVGLTDQQLWHGHDLFRDPSNNTPSPTHRKVIHYFGTQGAASHGTHTSGTLCGNDAPVGGTSLHDGLAKDARLYFQYYSSFPTGWDMNTWFAGPESGAAGLRAFNHSMSLSRKDTYNIYVFSDMTADQFVWNHRQFLHCNSMGNLTTNQMGHPVIAKNIISTGGTQNGTSCRSFY